jgi:hypothetical protein
MQLDFVLSVSKLNGDSWIMTITMWNLVEIGIIFPRGMRKQTVAVKIEKLITQVM